MFDVTSKQQTENVYVVTDFMWYMYDGDNV